MTVKNLETGEVFADPYDKLVIATGARATVPPIPGADKPHVFTLRNIDDMLRIKAFLDEKHPEIGGHHRHGVHRAGDVRKPERAWHAGDAAGKAAAGDAGAGRRHGGACGGAS